MPLVKVLASIATLGFGGSGGREGPTMQIGGALGSLVGGTFASPSATTHFLVAGTAAAMSAVFRTPLGAALLAVEVLHRDDFESDALVPSVLASVVSLFGVRVLLRAVHAVRSRAVPCVRPMASRALRSDGARRERRGGALCAHDESGAWCLAAHHQRARTGRSPPSEA